MGWRGLEAAISDTGPWDAGGIGHTTINYDTSSTSRYCTCQAAVKQRSRPPRKKEFGSISIEQFFKEPSYD